MPRRQVWKNRKPCRYSKVICFDQLLFGTCYYQHSQENIRQMKKRWGDIKHQIRRELQKTQKQTQLTCRSGINCNYLLRGQCRNAHSIFDLRWASSARAKLFQINCPVKDDCPLPFCPFFHEKKENSLYKEDQQRLKGLIAKCTHNNQIQQN